MAIKSLIVKVPGINIVKLTLLLTENKLMCFPKLASIIVRVMIDKYSVKGSTWVGSCKATIGELSCVGLHLTNTLAYYFELDI
jgi:hypothetical protein